MPNTRLHDDVSTLQRLREAASLTQHEVAERVATQARATGRGGVGVTAALVGRWERGVQAPSLHYRRLLAVVYDVPVADLGLDHPRHVATPGRQVERWLMDQRDPTIDARVQQSRDAWRTTRHGLNANRLALAKLAAQAYPPAARFGDTGLVAGPDWIPDSPVALDTIRLTLDAAAPTPAMDGTERESGHVRPACTLTKPYPRYTKAVADIDRPRLFDNRSAWRFTGLNWADLSMTFAPTSYFAAVDVNEVLAHEMALVCLGEYELPSGRVPRLGDLPYRRLVGDPFDFTRRPVMPAVSTLTIRGGPEPSFILHRRDSRSVAMAGDTLQVIPSGIFQPSSVLGQAADFSIIRNIEREMAEELLGFDEADGDGQPVDYRREPFATMDTAIANGQLRLWALGVGLDALTLVGEILTVAVLEPGLFDELARDFVEVNDEGTVVGERQPFTVEGVGGLLASGRMAPAGAGCLSLAWQHRDVLLG